MKKLVAIAVAAAFALGAYVNTRAEDKPSPIKEAMQKGHKSGLCGKVTKGEASDEDLKNLTAWYEAMCACKPPKGDEAAWQAKCKDLIAATKAVAAKEAGAVDKYKKAVNCMGCHSAHKP